MKIIFLDIDGVLNHHASLAEGIHLVNSKCALLRHVCKVTDAKIVVSSTWRLGMVDINAFNQMVWRCGGPYRAIIAYTPHIATAGSMRGQEIEEWLLHNDNIHNYVIVDDDSDMLDYQKRYFVQTDMRTGLTTAHANKMIQILNTKNT